MLLGWRRVWLLLWPSTVRGLGRRGVLLLLGRRRVRLRSGSRCLLRRIDGHEVSPLRLWLRVDHQPLSLILLLIARDLPLIVFRISRVDQKTRRTRHVATSLPALAPTPSGAKWSIQSSQWPVFTRRLGSVNGSPDGTFTSRLGKSAQRSTRIQHSRDRSGAGVVRAVAAGSSRIFEQLK